MTPEELKREHRRAYERARWHRRMMDPEFREREKERSKKRVREWLSVPENREKWNAWRREHLRKSKEGTK